MSEFESAATPELSRAYKWSEDQGALLKTLFEAGTSSAEIAAEINQQFGTSYTPMAVKVRANVMGLRRGYTKQDVVWTDEKNATLTKLIRSGRSYAAAANIMGTTRNAVGGQVRKLGLNQTHEESLRSRAFGRAMADIRKDGQRYARRMAHLLNWVPGKYREEEPLVLRPEVVSDPLNLTMAEVGVNQCRWIMNDDAAAPLFCGHDVAAKSWCAKHAEVVSRAGADWNPNPNGGPRSFGRLLMSQLWRTE